MADILQITEDIPVDDSIYEYEYKEYNPIVGTDLNRGSIVLTIESQDIYTHPAESFLVIDGHLRKMARGGGVAVQNYGDADVVTLINNDNPIHRANAADGAELSIDKISWFMPHVIPSDAYRLQLDKVIEKKEKIPVGYRMLQCDSTQVTTNIKTFTWRLGVKSSPDIPRFIIVGFQSNKDNNQQTNPAIFDPLYVRNIYVTLNAKRYPDTDYNNDFTKNHYSRIYGDAALFRKKFYNMDELISNPGIDPIDYKKLFPLYVFDVTKQSEKLKTSVSDIHIKAFFDNAPGGVDNPPADTMAYAVIISDRLFHFVSDGSKITNIV